MSGGKNSLEKPPHKLFSQLNVLPFLAISLDIIKRNRDRIHAGVVSFCIFTLMAF